MANYPFKINIQYKNGTTLPHYTSSFATDADTAISASDMVGRINLIPVGQTYTQDNVATVMHGSRKFGDANEGSKFISASYTTSPNTGSVVFTDTEDATNDGLDYYTFWGTKVCNVLGLPEGIPIYTETFKLSDDSSNPSNYLSGDVIADGIAIKESFKMAPQGRMRSNLVWDHQFGEGFLQWVSGSASKLLLGYDNVADAYSLSAATAATFNISGVDLLTVGGIATSAPSSNLIKGYDISSGLVYNSSNDLELVSGRSTYSDTAYGKGQILLDSQGHNKMIGDWRIYNEDDDVWDNESTFGDYGLTIKNYSDDAVGTFAGIAFDAGTETNTDAIAGAIAVLRDNATSTLHDGNMIFATNDAYDDGLTERMRITHDGNIGIGTTTPGTGTGAIASTLEIAGYYGRTAHHIGCLVGGYNNIATNAAKSNPIYIIGSSYEPTDAALGNMYGIGFCKSTATFIDSADNSWGLYVAANGAVGAFIAGGPSGAKDSYFNAGNIGIGAANPLSLLHIQQSTDNDDGGIRLYNDNDGTYWSQRVNTSEYLYFQYNGGSYGGHIRNASDVGQIDFTGQHRNSISTGTVNEHTGSIGYIVCADGTYDNLWDNNDNVKQDVKPNINESLPKVKLSNTAYDKTVFGVISELENNYQNTNVSESFTYNESGERILTQTTSSVYVREYNQGSFTSTMEAEDSNDQKLIINSLGEGAIWVSNYSGSLENGDYITSSPIQGLGMKQDDDLLHNYTVAKITQDCTFDMNASASYDAVEFEWSGSNYKRAFVGCTYHCG